MNIKDITELNALLDDLRDQDLVAVDSETNGLSVHEGQRPISLSFYFPNNGHSYNLAWNHGVGEFFIPATHRDTSKFHKWTWQGNGKKQVYKAYWYDKFRKANPDIFGNVPSGWVDLVKVIWNQAVERGIKVIYFNATFDIHMMEAIGFCQPKATEDVLIAVHLVFEDWTNPSIEVDGKKLKGNNRLKWQSDFWGIEGALDGETELAAKAEAMSLKLAEFIAANWDDPMNKSFHPLKRAARVDEIAKRVKFDPKSEMWCLPSDDVAFYAENDTRITWELRQVLMSQIEAYKQVELYRDLSDAQNEFIIRMERNGILLDRQRAEEQMDELLPLMDAANSWFIKSITDRWGFMTDEQKLAFTDSKGKFAFTVGSPQKLKVALEILTGEEWKSTDKDAVQKFEDEHDETFDAVEQMKNYKHAHRASQVYLANWIAAQDEQGFIHGGFDINGTVTGRLSSSSGTLGDTGNFQNIPSRGFDIKATLVTPKGWKLCQMDYGQLELRLASWIAGCGTMIRLFESGEDMHAYTRDQIGIGEILHGGLSLMDAAQAAYEAGKLKNQPTDETSAKKELQAYYRQVAKTANFGLLYGGTWRMLNRLLKVGEAAARDLHYAWNSLYPEFEEANAEWTSQALKLRSRPDGTGRVLYVAQPISNRTRKFGLYPISETVFDDEGRRWVIQTRREEAKDAFNFAVQGLGGYLMVMSSLKMTREFDNSIFRPFASIHDSIVFYVHEDRLDILPRLHQIMVDWDGIRPALTADVEISTDGTWQHLEGIDLCSLST